MSVFLRACVLTIAALLSPAAGSAGGPDAIVGTWLTEEGDSNVAITAGAGGGYAGKVVWLKEPSRDGKPVHDANNGDPALRDRPVLGLEILSGFTATGDGAWAGGMVYSPRAGKSYPAELSLTADGRLQLRVKAGLVSRAIFWTH